MMKRILVAILTVCMMLSVVTSCGKNNKTDDASKIKHDKNACILSIENKAVKKGETFTAYVKLANSKTTWNSFEFVAEYDPEILKINSVKKTKLSDPMIDMSNTQYAKNQFKLAFASGTDIEGNGEIAEIEFTAIGSGICKIKLTEPYMCTWNNDTNKTEDLLVETDFCLITVE